jgi:hypothetical protein
VKVAARQATKFLIDEREQVFKSLLVSFRPSNQEPGNGGVGLGHHRCLA